MRKSRTLRVVSKSLPNLNIAVSHPTIVRLHEMELRRKQNRVCLTNFPDHAGSVFIAKMHLPGPPLHMLYAAWHVSNGKEARR